MSDRPPAASPAPPAPTETTESLQRLLRALGWGLLVLAVLGLVPTTLLVFETHRLALRLSETGGLCDVLGMSCAGALTSEDAKFLGVPLSYLGFSWYVGLTVFLLLGVWGMRTGLGWPQDAWPGLAFFAGLGAAVPAVLLLRRFFHSADYSVCPFCVATHVVSLCIALLATLAFLVSLVVLWRGGMGESAADASEELHFNRRTTYLIACLIAAGAAAVSGLAGAAGAEATALQRKTRLELDHLLENPDIRREHLLLQGHEISEDASKLLEQLDGPYFGPADAPIRLAEVTAFGCPSCRAAHPRIKQLIADYGDLVRVDVINYPLDAKCNKGIAHTLHPGSCEAHLAALAAHRQGKFLEMADLLFENAARFTDQPWDDLAAKAGLDLDQFHRDFNDPATIEHLQRDMAIGAALRVNRTPSFVVGGVVLPTFDPTDAFALAVEQAE